MPDVTRISRLVFFMALALNCWFMWTGFGNTLDEYHSFRQSQTAITAYYLERNGFSPDYETPVLGVPWPVPLEFPAYQAIVATVHSLGTGLSLDESGRLVSMVFFWLCLFPLWHIMNYYLKDKSNTLLFLSLVLVSPTYIFWSRAFMIESTALFSGLTGIWLLMEYARSRKYLLLLPVTVAFSLCGTVKLTTFVVMTVPAVLAIYDVLKSEGRPKAGPDFRLLLIFAFVVPYALSIAWTVWAEGVRELNPLAARLFSRDSMVEWNFGNFNQKLLVFFILTALFCILLLINKKSRYRKLIIASFGCFAAGPLIFSNLYLRHDYYYFANFVFLVAALFLTALSMSGNSRAGVRFVGRSLYIAVFMVFVGVYLVIYYPAQRNNHTEILEFSAKIREQTNENDVLLIYGHDWKPLIPYYCGRKAVMDIYDYDPGTVNASKIIYGDNRNSIKAMIVKNEYLENTDFIRRRIALFGLDSVPVIEDSRFGTVFIKK